MKIAFVGTECTGKSTLSAAVADRLGIFHIPDPFATAYELFKAKGFSKPPHMSFSQWFNVRSAEEEWTYECCMHEAQLALEHNVRHLEHFVADSASLVRAACGLAYCTYRTPAALSSYVDMSRLHANEYTHLVYLPPTIPYVDNGHRIMNVNKRATVDWILRGMLTLVSGPKIVTLMSADLPQRVVEAASKVWS
jgi:nicotinamide riboside kinase